MSIPSGSCCCSKQGGEFKKKKYVLGICSGTEQIHLRLSSDEQSLLWKPQDSQKDPTKIDVHDVNLIRTQGSLGFCIVSQRGETLEVEADNEEQRNAWVTNLQLLCEDSGALEETAESATQATTFRKMVEEKAKKQAYWQQRTQELEERKREAEERKKKFAGVGMKYTAMAMANRTSSSDKTN